MHRNYERIYSVIKKIPKGRVATYGQIARLADLPGHARQVGYALHALPCDHDVPWHRVINAQGKISARFEPYFEKRQRIALEKEKIIFGPKGQVSLLRYQWKK